MTGSEKCWKQWWKYRTTALTENTYTICPENNAHFHEIGIYKNCLESKSFNYLDFFFKIYLTNDKAL